jgi:hypothetical protein
MPVRLTSANRHPLSKSLLRAGACAWAGAVASAYARIVAATTTPDRVPTLHLHQHRKGAKAIERTRKPYAPGGAR